MSEQECELPWLEKRKRVFERAGYKCEDCGTPAPEDHPVWCGLDIHHRQRAHYDHRDDWLGNLVSLCYRCHVARKDEHCESCQVCGKRFYRGGSHEDSCRRKAGLDPPLPPRIKRVISFPSKTWELMESLVHPGNQTEFIREAATRALKRLQRAEREKDPPLERRKKAKREGASDEEGPIP